MNLGDRKNSLTLGEDKLVFIFILILQFIGEGFLKLKIGNQETFTKSTKCFDACLLNLINESQLVGSKSFCNLLMSFNLITGWDKYKGKDDLMALSDSDDRESLWFSGVKLSWGFLGIEIQTTTTFAS